MTSLSARALLLGSTALLMTAVAGCSESSNDGTSGGGDRVNSTRVDLQTTGGLGGAGGAGGAPSEEPTRICSPDIVILDDLPECFVAEVSSQPLDCSLPGHEELRPEWENAARDRECAFRGLDAAACADLSLCGIAKATGSARASCQAGDSEAGAGYCAVDERTSGCTFTEVDSLFVYGVNPAAEALHVSCAIVGVE